jgi:hypothetical protein
MQRPSARLAESRHANIHIRNDGDRRNRENQNQWLLRPNEVVDDAQERRAHNNHESWKDTTFQRRVAIEVKEQKAGQPKQAPDEYERDKLPGWTICLPENGCMRDS